MTVSSFIHVTSIPNVYKSQSQFPALSVEDAVFSSACVLLDFVLFCGWGALYQIPAVCNHSYTHSRLIVCICTLVSMSVLCPYILSGCHGFVMKLQSWRGHPSSAVLSVQGGALL